MRKDWKEHKGTFLFWLAIIAVAIIAVTVTEFFPSVSDSLFLRIVGYVIIGLGALAVIGLVGSLAITIPLGIVQEMKLKRKVRSAKSMAYDLIDDDSRSPVGLAQWQIDRLEEVELLLSQWKGFSDQWEHREITHLLRDLYEVRLKSEQAMEQIPEAGTVESLDESINRLERGLNMDKKEDKEEDEGKHKKKSSVEKLFENLSMAQLEEVKAKHPNYTEAVDKQIARRKQTE